MTNISNDPRSKIKVVTMNGNLMPLNEAKVSITAPGLSYAALVFEGIRAYWNENDQELLVFRLDDHLKRFSNSMKILKFEKTPSLDLIKKQIIENIIANNYKEDIYIRLQGYIDDWGEMALRSPVSTSIVSYPRPRSIDFNKGKNFTVSSWQRLDDNASPPRVKASANYLNSRLASIQAKESGYEGAILLTSNGKVSEGPGGCIFLIREGVMITPSVSSGILESITRDSVLKIAKEKNLIVESRDVDRTELYIADEIFYCGTGQEIMPILSVDKILAGEGKVGDITALFQKEYTQIVRGENEAFNFWITPIYYK
ncbi:MAG: branched-chain-amino-acid transaminase [Alphaproteobacteria bacterium]|jgi:branched-chain amino acid aminotransferase|tara:strand:+ start:139 stop:1080 length:942 start_codon:yes stop_codon:yes gene_type:complete